MWNFWLEVDHLIREHCRFIPTPRKGAVTSIYIYCLKGSYSYSPFHCSFVIVQPISQARKCLLPFSRFCHRVSILWALRRPNLKFLQIYAEQIFPKTGLSRQIHFFFSNGNVMNLEHHIPYKHAFQKLQKYLWVSHPFANFLFTSTVIMSPGF